MRVTSGPQRTPLRAVLWVELDPAARITQLCCVAADTKLAGLRFRAPSRATRARLAIAMLHASFTWSPGGPRARLQTLRRRLERLVRPSSHATAIQDEGPGRDPSD